MNKQQALRILNSWHLIEFFQTYNVEAEDKSIQVSASELERYGDSLLPWLNESQRNRAGIKDDNVRYVLHLGLFPKKEAEQLSERLFGQEDSALANYEQEQRLDTDGMTCFAKLNVDKEGLPDFQSMSVSTLPWALGHLQQGTAAQLSVAAFRDRNALLNEELKRLALLLPSHPQSGKSYLTAGSLVKLLQILCDWAQYSPSSPFVLQFDWYPIKASASGTDKNVRCLPESLNKDELTDTTAVATLDEESESSEEVLPILNSFFLEDLERAMLAVAADEGGKALRQYLSIRQNRHSDLYSSQGLETITHHLAPEYMPHGRWPSDPRFSMSLMQQFSINTALKELKDGGLLSVNGPPGTGKTTMLRDLVAHNVVERAKALASFSYASEALDENGFLAKSLTGFEMVVASYNNAAVENISRELPQCKSLAKEFRDTSYLRPIANQLNARENRNGQLLPLTEEEQCWGMIAAIMGNKKNRSRFSQRFFFSRHFEKDSPEETARPDEFNFLNYWRWYQTDKPLSFTEAKKNFLAALAEVELLQKKLQQLDELNLWFQKYGDGKAVHGLKVKQSEAITRRREAEDKHEVIQRQMGQLDERVSILKEEYEALEESKPAWWQRLFKRREYQNYLQELAAKKQEHIAGRKSRLALQEQLTSAENRLAERQKEEKAAWRAWSEAHTAFNDAQQRYANLKQAFPELVIPGPQHSIQDADTQRYAFWQNEEINRKRSLLFIAAMALHQAWLAEATQRSNALRQNLIKMSSFLNSPGSEPHSQGMWQLLFMMVPVVSTTFASLGRMFSGVTEAQLGWLMIDEAGQALPQAAVGALWRAKRVLVVGDPLQIEPVFVTPPRLTRYLTEAALANDAEEWTPAKWSVQQIADRANPYGCTLLVMDNPVWVGIPLWVHRRCIEPMFSLSNQIAYDNRMIHGLDEQAIRSRPLKNDLSNCWFSSEGNCVRKQYKSELARDTQALLVKLAAAGYPLADIYVITPFKAVKAGLALALEQPNSVDRLSRESKLSRTELKAWRSKNIGTVHTFQGKENDIVILVLGCDTSNQGGAEWAASKPNLLNVALTRAKNHIFIVGDRAVWSNKKGFNLVAQALPEQLPA
ncbi:AAA domain-containing protein [Erwinia sp. BNK-24-b]|uniref:DEAD/DEAH box helicase n=1 Tax=unclassified Erwinia TaxID=2622719 RepID=UPI0039BFDF33